MQRAVLYPIAAFVLLVGCGQASPPPAPPAEAEPVAAVGDDPCAQGRIATRQQIDALIELLFSPRVETEEQVYTVVEALLRCDPRFALNDKAPKWLSELAAPIHQYRALRDRHMENEFLDEMLTACEANMPRAEPTPEQLAAIAAAIAENSTFGILGGGGPGKLSAAVGPAAEGVQPGGTVEDEEPPGTEEDARAALAELESIAARVREQLERIADPRRKLIARAYGDWYLFEIETLPYCERRE
jgi:hypothetical protein